MIFWPLAFVIVGFYPRYWVAFVLSLLLLGYSRLGTSLAFEISDLAYFADPFAISCVIVALRKWFKKRAEANYPVTTRR